MSISPRMVKGLILSSTSHRYIKGGFHTFVLPIKENNWLLIQEPGTICPNCNKYYPNLPCKIAGSCFMLYCWECQVR